MTEEKEIEIKKEINEFQKEKERIRNLVGEIGGNRNSQHRLIGIIFTLLIGLLLVLGVVLQKITLFLTLEIVTVVGIFKIIWMFYNTQRSSHFQFWILNSMEFKINELDKRIRKIEKLLQENREKK